MTKGALGQLDRILYILPRAAAEGGVSVVALAEELQVTRSQIAKDIHEVIARDYYHPASSGALLKILFEGDHLEMSTHGGFDRPTGLTGQEALAVALALRMRASGDQPDSPARDRFLRLTSQLERHASTDFDDSEPRERDSNGRDAEPKIHLQPVDHRDQIRDTLLGAHEAKRRLRICYIADRDGEPTERVIRPYSLATGDGHWYVVGHCEERNDIRVFRFDRVMDARMLDDGFECPEDFDASDHAKDGQVFGGTLGDKVDVAYSPEIARWVRERWTDGKDRADGWYAVRHQVSDARWLTQHVLRYGGEAMVVSPERYRSVVAGAAAAARGA
jgi:proteasome accessory factor C